MDIIKPKKSLGQHFLTDNNIAVKIVDSLSPGIVNVLEVGPGTGILSRYLISKNIPCLKLVEIDNDAVLLLKKLFKGGPEIIHGDFLKTDIKDLFQDKFAIIGNLPYHISSQILFRVFENRDQITEVIVMIQKEVAERIISPPGNKQYGILSILLQAFYDIKLLFTVNPSVFNPPPKVKSAVIKMKRNSTGKLDCNESLFVLIVKAGFNQRRKMLRNSLRKLTSGTGINNAILDKRPEQLNVEDFIRLTSLIEKTITP